MVYLAGIKDLNLLLVWTLAAVVVLAIYWILVKLYVVCCCCDVVVVVVFVGVFFLFLLCIVALCVGFFAVTDVTFSALYVGFCIPLCRVLYPSCRLCNLLYSINVCYLSKKKKNTTFFII